MYDTVLFLLQNLYCLETIVAQGILELFVRIFVHILTMENTAVTRVLVVQNIAIMRMDAYPVNIIFTLTFIFMY